MKKIISLIFIASVFFIAGNAHACSPVDGVEYPTIDAMLALDDTAIGLYRPLTDGPEVSAQLFLGNENAAMGINLKVDMTSCGMRSEDFKTNEYIVAIYQNGAASLEHSDLDNQFSFAFLNQEDATEKYTEYFRQWDDRISTIGVIDEDGNVSYVATNYSLTPGTKDSYVLALQTALKAKLNLGEEFKLDGSYGPTTTDAVKQFQVSEALTDDGIAGPLTQAKLAGIVIGQSESTTVESSYTAVSQTLRPGMKDDYVLALQTALKEKLNLGEDFKLDGSYGPATTAMVKQFQVSESLTDDGIAGPLTQAKLAGTETPILPPVSGDPVPNDGTEVTDTDAMNEDLIDTELRKILLRAKNEVINTTTGDENYTDAHALVIKYNNELLATYSSSDPLYNSSSGGEYFVYSAKLAAGGYICVDNDSLKEIVDRETRPDLNTEEVSC